VKSIDRTGVNDPLIERLRRTTDATTREELIADLLTAEGHATINAALSRRRAMIHPDDIEDLRAQVTLRLLRRLTTIESSEPIGSFADYAAVVTYHVVDDYVRQQRPERSLMANRIRYVLSRTDRFAIWPVGAELMCGRAEWLGAKPSPVAISVFCDPENIAASLDALFAAVGRAIPFQAVVSAFVLPLQNENEATTEDDALLRVESRDLLHRLWTEILALPHQQRLALLLGLRDGQGGSAIPLLALTGVATLSALAEAIGWTAAEISERWTTLPFDDRSIAAMLDTRPQQVINLRKAARARLVRRMARW
jgi:hypothetical protein